MDPISSNNPESFYDRSAHQEWDRLERHRTEFAVTLKALHEYLPKPPADVLDIGGGPGRYAIELTRQGYQVTLIDISSKSLELAQQKAKESGISLYKVHHSDAQNLSAIPSDSLQAALLMGPLYHLLSLHERQQAVHEALRVLKPGGRLFATFITRFAPFRRSAHERPHWLGENLEFAYRLLETGVNERGTKFTLAYFARPEEITPFMEDCGLKTTRLMGCEGVISEIEAGINQLQGRAWEAWVDFNYRLGSEPSLYGASDHLLYIGEKPEA
ncbi:MAG TPA: methyltransferase domain-containing protein [Anaerolineales bacterium]|nr:methyltransferase domain-containing protein [Anaerolineales bacterium]